MSHVRAVWHRWAVSGLQALVVPSGLGGHGAPFSHLVTALEAVGREASDRGSLFGLGAQLCACQLPLIRFGSDYQRSRYLPGLARGELIGAHAMSEPGSGSDAFALATTATPAAGGYILRGQKTFVTNAPDADLFILFATTDRRRGFAGLNAFVVARSAPGLTVGPAVALAGLQATSMADVSLDDCFVPDTALLGPAGAGMAIFNWTMVRERAILPSLLVGSMQRHFEACMPLVGGSTPEDRLVSHSFGSMKIRIALARGWLVRAAALLDANRLRPAEAALAKIFVSEAYEESCRDAINIHTRRHNPIEVARLSNELADARAAQIYSGTSEVLRDLVARSLGL